MAPPKQTQTNFTCGYGFADVAVGTMRCSWGTGFAGCRGGGGDLPVVLDLEEAPERENS